MTGREYNDCQEFVRRFSTIELPPMKSLERGGLVGVATITGCVTRSNSPWFVGPFGFTLKGARALPFYPWRGQLGFFDVEVYP